MISSRLMKISYTSYSVNINASRIGFLIYCKERKKITFS